MLGYGADRGHDELVRDMLTMVSIIDGWFRWLSTESDTIAIKPSGTTYENETAACKIS